MEEPLTFDEKKWLRESLDSSSSPKSVRRKIDPPSISGPPGQFEDDHVEKSDMEKMLRIVTTHRNKNRSLEESVAELKMANLDLEDNFRCLRISTNAKLKRIAKAIGQEDILAPPSP